MRLFTVFSACAAVFLACSTNSVNPKDTETIILISVDGFRWDYTQKANTPNLDYLIEHGVRAESLIPCFPTKTFPNHYSIVTGLYPENHGIVANNMYDPLRDKYFGLSNSEAIHDPVWWGGEPVWVTAEKQNIRAASYFWPGTSTRIQGKLPSYWYEYNGSVANETRVEQLLRWLDLPGDKRPGFLTSYFSILDDAGHDFDPESPEVVVAIETIDQLLGILLDGLRQRGCLDSVNVIIVSDHGMAPISRDRVIFLDDYIRLSAVQVVDWDPLAAINPAPGKEDSVYAALVNAHPHMQVYRKQEMPARFHYSKHERIPAIIAIAAEGWSISSHDYYLGRESRFDGGTHGYDNGLQSMGGLFVAHGPAFKTGFVMPSLSNIHLYELMTHILGINPAPNDGSLDSVRVALKSPPPVSFR